MVTILIRLAVVRSVQQVLSALIPLFRSLCLVQMVTINQTKVKPLAWPAPPVLNAHPQPLRLHAVLVSIV